MFGCGVPGPGRGWRRLRRDGRGKAADMDQIFEDMAQNGSQWVRQIRNAVLAAGHVESPRRARGRTRRRPGAEGALAKVRQ